MAASLLPSPRTPDPHRAPSLRWGIMGPGWIAQRFTATLQKHTSQQVIAVGSRNQARADEFAALHSVPTTYGSYEQLLADPGIDIVYIATPHTEHYVCALAALAAGKHVLVEKPLGVNAVQAAAIAESARTAGLFAGEAMWTKFLPKFDVIRRCSTRAYSARCHTVIRRSLRALHPRPPHLRMPELAGGAAAGPRHLPDGPWHTSPSGSPVSVVASGQDAAEGCSTVQISAIAHRCQAGNQASLHTTILIGYPDGRRHQRDSEATLHDPRHVLRARPVHRDPHRRNVPALRRADKSGRIRIELRRS